MRSVRGDIWGTLQGMQVSLMAWGGVLAPEERRGSLAIGWKTKHVSLDT